MSEKKILWRGAGTLVTMDPPGRVLHHAFLRTRGPRVLEVGSGPVEPRPDEVVRDLGGRVVLPGLVNAHHHLCQNLTRAYGPAADAKLFDWLTALYPVWAGFDPQNLDLAARVGAAELLLSGCTTTSDHHYLFPRDGAEDLLDATIHAARDLGIRFHATRGSMSVGASQGGLPPDRCTQDEAVILADSERVIDAFHDPSAYSMTQVALAPCAPFSVSRELMRETARLARAKGVRLHTHLAETEDENAYCLEVFGCRPLDFLAGVEWEGEDIWLAHGIHFHEAEIARLGAGGTGIAHCPTSNMRLGSGICPVPALRQAGCAVGLGVDGSASNDTGHALHEARQALYLRRLAGGAAAMTVMEALELATRGGAACLGRPEIGWIGPESAADFAVFDLDEEIAASGAHDPVAALLLCGPLRAHTVVVNGRVVVDEGQLLTENLARLLPRHREAARRLVEGA
jgi:cytosine/adenosine deaminase-related metal-dependent hydrolase